MNTDENAQNYQQMSVNSHIPNKTMTKHYMSPTIAAASKTIAPRKKILTERNEGSESAFSHAHDGKAPILGNEGSGDSLAGTIPPSPPVSKCNNNEEDVLLADLSCQPYDPLTNYLSPRPRFLRYNPDRRRGVLFAGENGTPDVLTHGSTAASTSGSSFDSLRAIVEGASSNCSSLVSSPSSSSGEAPAKQEDEKLEEFDEEMEQSDDEECEDEGNDGCWNLKGVLKSLLLLVVLVLSASCISSVHPPATIRDGYYITQNHTVEAIARKLESGQFFLDQRDERETGFMEVNKRDIEKRIEKGSMFEAVLVKKHESVADCIHPGAEAALFSTEVGTGEQKFDGGNFGEEHTGKLEEMENYQIGVTEVVEVAEVEKRAVDGESDEAVELQSKEGEVVKLVDVEKKAVVDGLGEAVELQNEEIEAVGLAEVEKKAIVDELGEIVELQTRETELVDVADGEKIALVAELGEGVQPQTGEPAEGSCQMVEIVDHHGIETPEKTASSKDYLISLLSEERPSDMLNSFGKQNQVTVDSVEIDNEEAGDMEVDSIMEVVGNFTNLAGDVISEKTNSYRIGFGEILNLVCVGNLSKELIKHMETEIVLKGLISLLVFSAIVASLVLGFHLNKKKTIKHCNETVVVEPKKLIEKDFTLPSKPYSESMVEEKCRTVLPSWKDEQLERIYSFRKNTPSSIHSTKEGPEEYYQSRAPTVELLSEIVVREVNSSLRISSIEKKTNESEESNYSVSSEKKMSRNNGNSVSVQAQPTHSEFSTMDSPSYGSYTTKQKIIMKKEVS